MKIKKLLTKALGVTLIMSISLPIASCSSGSPETIGSSVDTTESTTETSEITTQEESMAENTEEITSTTTEATTTTAETTATYENNQYYSLEDSGSFVEKRYSGDVINIIHKVKANVTCSIEASAIAYDENGDVLDKVTDEVTLVKDEYNFFLFQFKDISVKEFKKATIEYSSAIKYDLSETTRAVDYDLTQQIGTFDSPFEVIMTKFSKKKDKFYLSLEFQKGYLDYFDKFKILFYKGDKIVGCEDGYFNIYAEGLKKAGDKDVVKMSIPESAKKFDKIEFFFEPQIYPF